MSILVRATRGAATKLRDSPFTETAIDGAYALIYRPGVLLTRDKTGGAWDGTWLRGKHTVGGWIFTFQGTEAVRLLAITAAVDLLCRYVSAVSEERLTTIADIVFGGDTVGVEAISYSTGTQGSITAQSRRRDKDTRLVGIPFRAQITTTVDAHVTDVAD